LTAVADDDVALVHVAVMSRVERHPAGTRRVELDPRMALGRLAFLPVDVEMSL